MSLVLDVTMDEVLEWALCKDEMSTHPDQCETVDYRSGRQGRESYGVKVPCRQLPDSDG
ncbi:MAG: hypothetical protein OEU80_15950 [Deltaproteobacteria bacterium]|nr:hypothetical protein [Deltaproteobacteria bacterium]